MIAEDGSLAQMAFLVLAGINFALSLKWHADQSRVKAIKGGYQPIGNKGYKPIAAPANDSPPSGGSGALPAPQGK